MRKYFTKLSQLEKLVPTPKLHEKLKKQIKNESNQVYDGFTESMTNKASKPFDNTFRPRQHPINFDSPDVDIIAYKQPPRNLTPYNRVPNFAIIFEEPPFESPMNSRSLEIGLIGPPNAGKSTLINYLVGRTISAASPKAMTTAESVKGVFTNLETRTQLVFHDTPGAIKSSKNYVSTHIQTKSWSILGEVDQVCFVVDSVKRVDFLVKESIKRLLRNKYSKRAREFYKKLEAKGTTAELKDILKELGEIDELDKEGDANFQSVPAILVMNKVDLIENKRKFWQQQQEIEECGVFDRIFQVSAYTGYGIDGLRSYLESKAQLRDFVYHPSVYTAQTEVDKIQQIVTGNLFKYLNQEVPFTTGVRVREYVPKSNGELLIGIELEVKNKNQISIVKGRDGLIIKRIKEESERDLKMLMSRPIKTKFEIVCRNRGEKLQNVTDEFQKSI